eukprot:6482991-Amphidinium_carterae.2
MKKRSASPSQAISANSSSVHRLSLLQCAFVLGSDACSIPKRRLQLLQYSALVDSSVPHPHLHNTASLRL